MARNNNIVVQLQALKDQRERDQRAAVASGNVDENSALYRHAKLNGWDLGGEDELHGPARANAVARDAAATDLVEQRAAGAPRSPISAFAADGEGNFSFYNEDNALRAGFDGIMANANAQKADRARRGRATLGSMVGHAMDNGGMVPRELGAAYGQELGMNGPAFGTLAKDGTFMSLGIGQDGKMQPTGLVRPFDVLGSMVQSGDWKNAQKYAKKYLDGKYTPEQIAGATGFSPQWARGAATNELSAADKKLQLEALKVLQEMDKANKTPVTAEDFYRNNPRLITMLGTDYQRDENGRVVMDEMTGKPIEIALPPEEISKRAVAFFDGLRQSQANGGGTGMNEIQRAIVDGIRALTTPPAAQQTANIPQTGFYYRRETPNGPEMVAANGYVVGGKAYDRYGNLMQGVQPLDYQGNPISGNAPSDAQVEEPVQGQDLSQQQGDEQITLPDGSQGVRHNGKTYRITGTDQNGNIKAELIEESKTAQEAQQPSAPLSQPVTSLETPTATAQTATPRADGNAERERRLRNGARMRGRIVAEEAERARRERPLSETPIRELPGAALRKAADWAVEDVKKTGRNVADVTDAVLKAGAKMSADTSSQLAEMGGMTPSEIAQNAKNEIKMYLDSIKRAFQAQMKSDASARNGSGEQADSYAEWEKLANKLDAVLNDANK